MNAAALFAFLAGNAPIKALIGGETPRIYWKTKPQDELRPCLVLDIPDESDGHSLSGKDGYALALLQITCFAPTYADTKTLAATVSAQLDGQAIADEEYTETDRADLPIIPADGKEKPLLYGVLISMTVEA